MIIKPPQNVIYGLSKYARKHSRYRGCTIHYAMFEGGGAVATNLVNPGLFDGTINGTLEWGMTSEGLALIGDGTTWIDTGYAADQTARSWSVMMRFVASSANTGGFGVLGAFDFTGTNPDPYLSVDISDTPGVSVASRDTIGSTDVDSASLAVDVFDDQTHTVIGVYDTATAAIRIYVDGVGASGAITTNSSESKNLTAATIGIMTINFNTGPGTPPIMSLLEARWYQDRVLTDAEARSFTSRPYLEYEWAYQHRRRIWTVGAAGLTQIDITEAGEGTDTPIISALVSQTDVGVGTEAPDIGASLFLLDSATGLDTITSSIMVALLDVATGLDSPSISVSCSTTDAGAGQDSPVIAVSLSLSDASTGVDAPIITVNLALADQATGVDTILTAIFQAIIDSGTGTDALSLSASIPVSDTGSGVDTIEVQFGEFFRAVTDAASGTDTVAINVALSAADTGAGTDALTVAVTFTIADAAVGSDVLLVSQLIAIIDAAQGTDSLLANASVGMTDTATGVSQVTITAYVPISESGSGADAIDVAFFTLKSITDSATGMDALAVSVTVPLPDTAQGLDSIVQILAQLAVADSGSGTDTPTVTAGSLIAKIEFSLAQRTATITLKQRSQSMDITGGGNTA